MAVFFFFLVAGVLFEDLVVVVVVVVVVVCIVVVGVGGRVSLFVVVVCVVVVGCCWKWLSVLCFGLCFVCFVWHRERRRRKNYFVLICIC